MAVNKISLPDLLDFALNKRQQDLISMPNRQLLIVRFSQAEPNSAAFEFANTLEAKRLSLAKELIDPILTRRQFSGIFDAQYELFLKLTQEGIEQFGRLIRACGEEKMTPDNYLKILQGIGLPYELLTV